MIRTNSPGMSYEDVQKLEENSSLLSQKLLTSET
jgi:hypothetical protein